MKFKVGDKVRIISQNTTGIVDEVDIPKEEVTVIIDNAEEFAKKFMPKERFKENQKIAAAHGRNPIAKFYTTFDNLELLPQPNPEFSKVWDTN